MKRVAVLSSLILIAAASPVSAQRPEGRDDATYVHDALICMGTYQYVFDTGTDDYVGTMLKQKAAEDVYHDIGGKGRDEIEADTIKAVAAMRQLVEKDPASLDGYIIACDGEFGDIDDETQ